MLFADASARAYHLSEVLALLTAGGANLTVVTRPAEHNDTFLARLAQPRRTRAADGDPARRRAREDPVREDWLLTGSMNFTMRGMQVNDEAVTYKVSEAAAAQARIDFTRRWRDLP